MKQKPTTDRRHFLAILAAGAASVSAVSFTPLAAGAHQLSEDFRHDDDPDAV